MAITVNWCFRKHSVTGESLPALRTMLRPTPVRVLSKIVSDPNRSYAVAKTGSARYAKCPAFVDYMKNMYELQAPYDIEFNIDENGTVVDYSTPSPNANKAVVFRTPPDPNTNIVITLSFQYVFYSSEDVMVEELPPFADYTLMEQGVTVVPGTFNISKWVRPVEGAYEIRKGVRKVCIKTGTPLAYVRFITKNGESVVLKEVEDTDALREVVDNCVALKDVRPGLSLAESYAYAKEVVTRFLRPKRCPFHWGKK